MIAVVFGSSGGIGRALAEGVVASGRYERVFAVSRSGAEISGATNLTMLDGSCRTPIAAHLFDEGANWRLTGEVLSVTGDQRWTATGTAPKSATMAQLAQLGRDVASEIRAGAKGNLPVFGDER